MYIYICICMHICMYMYLYNDSYDGDSDDGDSADEYDMDDGNDDDNPDDEDYSYDYDLKFESTATERSDLACIFDEQNCNPTEIDLKKDNSNEPISTKPNSSEPISTKDSSNIGLIIGITGGSLVVFMMISLFGWFLKRWFENQKDSRIEILPTSIVNENYSPKLVTIVNENNEFQCQFV